MTEEPKLVLGSSSPRRRDLMNLIGLEFSVMKPEVEEVPGKGESPHDYVTRLSKEKAEWIAGRLQTGRSRIVISADTIVVLDEQILEKPNSTSHAKSMLSSLSDRKHRVLTGVCLVGTGDWQGTKDQFTVTTEVKIKKLSDREIDAYIRSGEPMDKAGGYAAQGIGSYMVEEIVGSYTNVVGLPTSNVVFSLENKFKYQIW